MVKRSYHAAQHGTFKRRNSPFLNISHEQFSANVPRKFMGHKGRYNFTLPNINVSDLNKIKSGCISHMDKKTKMKLFKYQKFVSAYVDPRTPYSCLVWHSVGSGKTMTMWHIVEGYLRRWHCKADKKQIFLISNPKQLEGFENELKVFNKITGIKKYMTKFSRSVQYGDAQRKARYGCTLNWKRPQQTSQLILMNFVEAAAYAKKIGFANSVVILDEAHNIVNPPPTYTRYKSKFAYLANHLSDCVSNKNVKVVPLTATPVKENISEISTLLNMVSKTKKFPTSQPAFLKTYQNNLRQFKKDTRGLISYFNREADLTVQPRKLYGPYDNGNGKRENAYGETYIQLGEHQIESIMKNTKAGEKQNNNLLRVFATFSGVRNNDVKNHCNKLNEHLKSFGPKLIYILNKIEQTKNEKHWVYCGLQKRAGVKPISESLRCKKWTQVMVEKCKTDKPILEKVLKTLHKGGSVSQLPGEDYKRFVVLESSTPKQLSSLVLQILNHHHNVAGKLIRVIVGDSSRKEGMDLYSIKNVHIVSPEYKYSDWHQAISRAIRYCSFKYVPIVKDWQVRIFTYVGTTKSVTPPGPKNKKGQKRVAKMKMLNIDERVLDVATVNANKMLPFLQAMKEGAIDCFVNKGMHKIENFNCDMKPAIVHKKKPPKPQPKPKTPMLKNNEFTWITYFSRLSGKSLHEWIKKCKEGKCNKVQTSALKVVTSKSYNPFSGSGTDKSINITEFNKSTKKTANGYNIGYKEYNYNKGYKQGAKLTRTPTRSMLSNNPPNKSTFERNKYYGQQNAQLNAMRNGYRQL